MSGLSRVLKGVNMPYFIGALALTANKMDSLIENQLRAIGQDMDLIVPGFIQNFNTKEEYLKFCESLWNEFECCTNAP